MKKELYVSYNVSQSSNRLSPSVSFTENLLGFSFGASNRTAP